MSCPKEKYDINKIYNLNSKSHKTITKRTIILIV